MTQLKPSSCLVVSRKNVVMLCKCRPALKWVQPTFALQGSHSEKIIWYVAVAKKHSVVEITLWQSNVTGFVFHMQKTIILQVTELEFSLNNPNNHSKKILYLYIYFNW